MGWIRALHYTRHRVVRLPGSTGNIAAGLAIGAAISFSPLMGTHFVQAALIAYIARVHIGAALIGTFVGNPWTFPFMWWAAISFGEALFGLFNWETNVVLPDHFDMKATWHFITHDPLHAFLPWLVGGYLLAVLSWPVFYVIFNHLIKTARFARSKAKLRKVHKVAKEVTGQDE